MNGLSPQFLIDTFLRTNTKGKSSREKLFRFWHTISPGEPCLVKFKLAILIQKGCKPPLSLQCSINRVTNSFLSGHGTCLKMGNRCQRSGIDKMSVAKLHFVSLLTAPCALCAFREASTNTALSMQLVLLVPSSGPCNKCRLCHMLKDTFPLTEASTQPK